MFHATIRPRSVAGGSVQKQDELSPTNLDAITGGDAVQKKTPPIKSTISEIVVTKALDVSSS